MSLDFDVIPNNCSFIGKIFVKRNKIVVVCYFDDPETFCSRTELLVLKEFRHYWAAVRGLRAHERAIAFEHLKMMHEDNV
jgi:hypothetical protein